MPRVGDVGIDPRRQRRVRLSAGLVRRATWVAVMPGAT